MCSEYCELGNLNDYISKREESVVELQEEQLASPELGLKRRSSLLVKSTSGVPMLREDKIWQIFAEMAKCIQHVHDNNLVHLDIKPSNFLINAQHKVKLTDFGVSIDLRQLETIQDNDQAGDSIFMAPELLKTDLPLKQRIT